MNVKEITLQPIADFSSSVSGFKFVSVSLGFDGAIYLLLVDRVPGKLRDGFEATVTRIHHTYKVIRLTVDSAAEIDLHDQKYNFHFVQPIDDVHFLLVGARARYRGKSNFDRNGVIFDNYARPVRHLLLGDGIRRVQTTKSGNIWVAYTDEGVYGNYGWRKPIGSHGLCVFDSYGNLVRHNEQQLIDDCLGLNVVSDDQAYFYYYSDYELVRCTGKRMVAHPAGIKGAGNFLFSGGMFLYEKDVFDGGKFALMQDQRESGFEHVEDWRFLDENDEVLNPPPLYRAFRGDTMVMLNDAKVYRMKLMMR